MRISLVEVAGNARELGMLLELHCRVFELSDRHSDELLSRAPSWVLFVGSAPVGFLVLEHGKSFAFSGSYGTEIRELGTLYATLLGVLPEWRGKGLGAYLKAFQVAYARVHGFTKIVTICRAGNRPIQRLNAQFGFIEVRRVPVAYRAPADDALVWELALSRS